MPPSLVRTAFRAGVFLVAAVGAVGCGTDKPQQKAAPPPPQVTVARPVAVPVEDYLEYNGHLETPQAVEVRARVKGFLRKIHFVEGNEVRGTIRSSILRIPGDRLYSIDDKEYRTAERKAEADLGKARADVDVADAEIRKAKVQIEQANTELVAATIASGKGAEGSINVAKAKALVNQYEAQLAAATASKASAEANVASAEATLHTARIQLGYTDIRAPISGRISRTLVEEDNLVGQSEPTLLAVITRMDELDVIFDVPERDVLEYMKRAEALGLPLPPTRPIPFAVRVPGPNPVWRPGHIDYVEGRVDQGTGTVRVRGVIDNPVMEKNNVRVFVPGLYVQVRVPRTPRLKPDEVPLKLTIPEDAIQTGQEGRFVFVVRPTSNTVEKRLVTTGATVWKAPPPDRAGEARWALVNPKPAAAPPPAPDQKAGPPRPTRLRVEAVVAIESGLQPDDRVIVNGIQKARPEAPVQPEEWVLTPPPK